MSDLKFNFSRERRAEDPLYLDFTASRPQGRRRTERAPDDGDDPNRPLRLERPGYEPGRRGGGVRLILGGGLALLLAAGAAAALLAPRLLHRPPAAPAQGQPASEARLAAPSGPTPQAPAPAPTPAPAPALDEPAPAARPVPAAAEPVRRAPRRKASAPKARQAHARAHVRVARKPAAAVDKPRAPKATAKRPIPQREEAARAHRRAPAELDLDSLAKSLQ